ncbi:MAG: PDZ domain-containing protein [Planctomycetes bacterium]|nr:PDZ domain-containing protein [Planctomycetota bacterium]
MRPTYLLWSAFILGIGFAARVGAEDRAERVRKDLEEITAGGRWIYNDLEKGFEEARKSGKPLLVVIRCIPCEACRGFDEQVASFDKRVQQLLERFVRVRIPQSNGLDLSLFQFDYDLSFYAFFLNADRTIYGRFGTRSTQEDKTGEVSIGAFREAMAEVLKLHEKYAEVKGSLKAKRGPAPRFVAPEEYPALKGKYKSTLDYQGKVVQSCIHCHQIRDSERLIHRSARQPIPDPVLYPWPLPEVFGLHLDPHRRAAVERVKKGSVAEKSGFREGDELVALEGQPLISIADVQWVLHGAGDGGELKASVRRGAEELALKIPLRPGWRKRSDISWRVTTWELRRMGSGGLLLEDLPAEDRRKAGLGEDRLALRVEHAGEYGEHAVAKNAGFRKGDIIIALDGRTGRLRETDFLAYSLQQKLPGDRLQLTVLRGGEKKELSFPLQ